MVKEFEENGIGHSSVSKKLHFREFGIKVLKNNTHVTIHLMELKI